METLSADVIIVGAGPSGASAAYDLATAGKSVLLLDKASFPRLKPCAGGLTIKAVNCLRYSVAPVTRRICANFQSNFGGRKKLFESKYPVVYMTVREEFDVFNLTKAREAGACFQQIGAITAIEYGAGVWKVKTANQSFEGPYLIGADGANSRVRKLCFEEKRRFAFAAEAILPVKDPENYEMEMDFASAAKGYAWIFPKGDHLNVGIYSLRSTHGIKSDLVAYVQQRLQRQLDPKTIVGHRIPIGGHSFHHEPGTPFLVGDAAGLVDPFFGEGIYNALRSGQIAASSILAMDVGEPDGYDLAIGAVRNDLRSYWAVTRVFYGKPSLGYRFLCSFPIRKALMKGVALGWTTQQIIQRCYQLPFRNPDPRQNETRL